MRPAGRLACTMALALGALAGLAQAETTPYYVGASQTYSRESNLLRLANGTDAPAGYSRGDTVSATALLAGFDQPFGRQRGYANVSLRSTRYAENARFNNQGYSATGGLDWSTVSEISGSLSASASRALSTFNLQEVGLLSQRNLESTQTLDSAVRMGIGAQWAAEVSAGRRKVGNSIDQPSVQSREFSQDTAALGLRWRPSGMSNFGLFGRDTRGRYPKFRSTGAGFEADRFQRQDLDLTASLAPSGLSSYDLRLTWGKTAYDLNEQRDFSGLTGAVGWAWRPSGKLRTDLRLSRDVGQDSYAVTVFNTPGTADYSRVNDTVRLRVDYDLSSKIAFSITLTEVQRELVRTIDNPFVPLNASGRERLSLLGLGARWAPSRGLLFGCDVGTERRRGDGPLVVNLDANTTSCYAQITLQ